MTDNIENYKYDRAIDLIRRIKTEETHEREVDRHKAFDLAIDTLEKQIPKKPIESNKYDYNCPCCNIKLPIEPEDIYIYRRPTPNHCEDCGQALDWSDTE